MSAPRLRKAGVEPTDALSVTEAGNVMARAMPSNPAESLQTAYMLWVEAGEMQLASLTRDLAIVAMLQTPRYWQVCSR